MVHGFYTVVYDVVNDPSTDSIISWGKRNKTFVIWNPRELIDRGILGRYTISRLFRMLCFFGFKRVKGTKNLEFGHMRYFVRGQPELMEKMQLEAVEKMRKKYREKAAKAKEDKEDQEAADWFRNLQI